MAFLVATFAGISENLLLTLSDCFASSMAVSAQQRRATDELNQKGEAYVILILEILLTAAAWRRGWNALALVPLAIVIVVGIALGAMMGVSHPGQSTSELTQQLAPIALCGDLLALAALGTMAARGRQTHF